MKYGYNYGTEHFFDSMKRQAKSARKRHSEIMENLNVLHDEMKRIPLKMQFGTAHPQAELKALHKFEAYLLEANFVTSLLLDVNALEVNGPQKEPNRNKAAPNKAADPPRRVLVQDIREQERAADEAEQEHVRSVQEQVSANSAEDQDDDDWNPFPGVVKFLDVIPEVPGMLDQHDRLLPIDVASSMTKAEKTATLNLLSIREDRKKRRGRWNRPCGRYFAFRSYYEGRLYSGKINWIATSAIPHENVVCRFCGASGCHFTEFCPQVTDLQMRKQIIGPNSTLTSTPCYYCQRSGEGTQIHPSTLCPLVAEATRMNHIIRTLSEQH